MKKATMSLLIGLLLGTMLAGPAVEAASGILAEYASRICKRCARGAGSL